MHSGHGFAYDTMRRAEVYSRHPLEAGQDSLALQHSLATSANLEHQVCPQGPKKHRVNCKLRLWSFSSPEKESWSPSFPHPFSVRRSECLLFFRLFYELRVVNEKTKFPWDLKFNHFLGFFSDQCRRRYCEFDYHSSCRISSLWSPFSYQKRIW